MLQFPFHWIRNDFPSEHVIYLAPVPVRSLRYGAEVNPKDNIRQTCITNSIEFKPRTGFFQHNYTTTTAP